MSLTKGILFHLLSTIHGAIYAFFCDHSGFFRSSYLYGSAQLRRFHASRQAMQGIEHEDVKAEVFVTCPGRNFVTLKITLRTVLRALGMPPSMDVSFPGLLFAGSPLSAAYWSRCAPYEDIWQFFYKGAYWRRGPVTSRPFQRLIWRCGILKPKLPTAALPVTRRRVS